METEADKAESPGGNRDKICLVCGDKALGYNFNAITCESCKAFFRRNALKDKDFKCPFNKKCEINPVTRRFCQLCRLIKCFEIGMKKEYIMSEEDKREKRLKIKEKRANLLVKNEGDESIDASEETSSLKRTKLTEVSPSNPLNMASISNKTYEKRLGHSIDQTASYPSPALPEPSSPVGTIVMEAKTSNVSGTPYESSRSRPVEIYQLIKSNQPHYEYRDCDSSTIQNILSADHGSASAADGPDCRSRTRIVPTAVRSDDNRTCGSQKDMPLLTSLVGGAPGSSFHSAYRTEFADEIFNDIPRKSSSMDLTKSIDSILSEAIKLEYEAYSSLNPRINSRELNDAERAKLNELIVANKALLAPLDDYVSASLVAQEPSAKDNLGSRPMLVDVLNLTAVAIRRLIKMAKKVNAFKNMCQEDQVALLKGGCTEMMILRSAMTYDSDRGSWKLPHSKEILMNIKVDVLKEAGGKVFEEHQRFLQTFDPKWRQDENIMLILSAITLFTPDRPRVVHYDVIKLEQNSYYYLLRRYLESTYPGCEARSTFLKLIHKIAELHRLNEDHVRVYMEQNPQDVEPLLIEIFDLSPR